MNKYKKYKQPKSQLKINKTVVGDSIELMVQKIRAGEKGEDVIAERDLIYNEGESTEVNPLTNFRTDKEELRLDEADGKYNFHHREKKGAPNPEAESEEQTEE